MTYLKVNTATTPTSPAPSGPVSIGAHTNEPVVATAASASVPNRFVSSFPSVTASSPAANILALTHLLRGNGVGVVPTSTYNASITTAVTAYQKKVGYPLRA